MEREKEREGICVILSMTIALTRHLFVILNINTISDTEKIQKINIDSKLWSSLFSDGNSSIRRINVQ